LYLTVLHAQVAPKNKTLSNVVSYQIHQQKLWNYNQLPKNSVLYKSDPRYFVNNENKYSFSKLHIHTVTIPLIDKKTSASSTQMKRFSPSFIQTSRFLSYVWGSDGFWTPYLLIQAGAKHLLLARQYYLHPLFKLSK